MKNSLFFVFLYISIIVVLCANDPNLEWTDPISGTYYTFASLKRNPQ